MEYYGEDADFGELWSTAFSPLHEWLKRASWQTGNPWGYEVTVPAGYSGASGRTHRRPLSHWVGQGITRVDGSAIAPDARRTALVHPPAAASPQVGLSSAPYAEKASGSGALGLADRAED